MREERKIIATKDTTYKNTGHIETNDMSILKRYGKAHNPEEMEGMVKTCGHCNQGKQYRHGRFFTPCPICSKARIKR
jgi:hypothetical protein